MEAFGQYGSVVETLGELNGKEWPTSLLMRREGDWATYYAPFDHINLRAKIVLVGITPGLQQATNGLNALRQELRAGTSPARALQVAKGFASFSGPMRQNLIDLLDHIGLPHVLGIESTARLFDSSGDLVHFTSALRYPVTYRDKNYGGSPSITKCAFTLTELARWFAEEAATLADAIYVPLGPAVCQAVEWLKQRGHLNQATVLYGLPHPSPANAERIAYFLGRKPKESLSEKTDAAKIDVVRDQLLRSITACSNAPDLPRRQVLPAITTPLATQPKLNRGNTLKIEQQPMWIPVANDGTRFDPKHRRERGYQVGPKGAERYYEAYPEALKELQKNLEKAYWRRPNSKGNWGIVRAIRWEKVSIVRDV